MQKQPTYRNLEAISCRRAIVFFAIIFLAGCRTEPSHSDSRRSTEQDNPANQEQAAKESSFFRDVTESVGINFVNRLGNLKEYHFPDIMVAGCGVIDFDRDGRLDLILVGSGDFAQELGGGITRKPEQSLTRIYRQTESGGFSDVTERLGFRTETYGCGVAVADVNNDGFDDIYLTNYSDDQLWINERGSGFRNATKSAGVSNPSWATSATFLDYDRDGRLDLFVTNYVSYVPGTNCANAGDPEDFCNPRVFDRTVDKLFRNVSSGESVRFEDVSAKMGITSKSGPGLGVVARDFNEDGYPDLYVANDGYENFLWLNQQGKSFVEQAGQLGCATSLKGMAQAGMGVATGDVDGNQTLDIVVTHLDGETNAAYLGTWNQLQSGRQLYFTESGGRAGVQKISKPMTGFGIGLPDLDNDGDPDMLVVNGRVTRRKRKPANEFWSDYAEHNQIALNDGRGKYSEVRSPTDGFLSPKETSRGLSIGDYDNDGKLDCLVSNIDGPARLFRNRFADGGNWIGLLPVLPNHGGRSAIGAVVELTIGDNDQSSVLRQTVQTDGSYLSAKDPRVHFGLGQRDRVTRIRIIWPDGTKEEYGTKKFLPINRYHVLEQGSGSPVRTP